VAVQSLLDRGLVEIVPDRIGWKATFTEAGAQALRALAQDRRRGLTEARAPDFARIAPATPNLSPGSAAPRRRRRRLPLPAG
jgi:hypothetical protein